MCAYTKPVSSLLTWPTMVATHGNIHENVLTNFDGRLVAATDDVHAGTSHHYCLELLIIFHEGSTKKAGDFQDTCSLCPNWVGSTPRQRNSCTEQSQGIMEYIILC